ncbi:MAG: hypothetical protein ACYSUK_11830 [Planctomycetota bacterium]|jgi:hypothetical protein
MKIIQKITALIRAKEPSYCKIMNNANKVAMLVAGVMLLVASILKSHQLLTEPILSTGFWESWHRWNLV